MRIEGLEGPARRRRRPLRVVAALLAADVCLTLVALAAGAKFL